MVKKLFSIEGKVALITGGNQGIGQVFAENLAEAGAHIIVADLNDPSETAKNIAEKHGVRTMGIAVDVTDQKAVNAMIEQAVDEMGTLDILCNNAGITTHKGILDLEEGEWEKVIDVNLNGIYYVAAAFANYLVGQNKGGSIINTASMSGLIVNVPQEQASYNASKAAVIHFTKSMAVELAEKNIRVNCISPGYIETEMTGQVRQDWQDAWLQMIPFKRMGTPEELVGAVIYLASDASSYTSGSNIVVDGCYTVV